MFYPIKRQRKVIFQKISSDDKIIKDSYVQQVVCEFCNENQINLKSIQFSIYYHKVTVIIDNATKQDADKLGKYLLHNCYDYICNLKY